MQEANPTAGDSGASTLERLEGFLAAQESSAQDDRPEPPTQEAESEPDIAEEAPVDTEGDAQQQEDGPQLTTADLAKLWGIDENLIDVDDAGQISVKTKIDGQEGAAKLQDLLKSYQLQGHIDNKARALAEQQQAIQSRMAEVEQYAQSRFQYAEDLASIALNDLNREFQAVDWQTLRMTDPAEYAARQHDFQMRGAQLQQSLQTIQQSREQHHQQTQAQQQQQREQYVQQQREALLNAIPEWKDSSKAEAGKKELGDYLRAQGYTPDEVSSVFDHRQVITARKAMLYDQLMASKAQVEAKVRAAPKIVKPGQPQPQTRQEQSIRNIKSTIRNSGGRQGIADYLLATGKA